MTNIGTILSLMESNDLEYSFSGDAGAGLSGFSSLSNYREGTLTWARNEALLSQTLSQEISCLVLPYGVDSAAKNQIHVSQPRNVFFFLIKQLWGAAPKAPGVGQGTYISPEAEIDSTASIGCNCVIDGPVEIKAGTVIEHNVSLLHKVLIGRDCLIHSGAVIGSDGFGYTFDKENRPIKIEHFGGVQLGDRVEVGANSCIDRGTIDDTVIGADTKIDDLVHISHNVHIGAGVSIVMGANVCGSAIIEDSAYLAPGAIVKNGVRVGANAFIGMGAIANRMVEPNSMLYEKSTHVLKNVDYHKML